MAMRDWFAAFARERDTDARKTGATRATRVTLSQNPREKPTSGSGCDVERSGNPRATPVTPTAATGKVTQVAPRLPKGASGRVTLGSQENQPIQAPVTRVAHVTHEYSRSDLTADDWRDFYQERAAIMEYDGEISREEAERLALDWCIMTWMAANPPCGLSKELCSACGESIGRVGEDSIPLLAGRESHAWVHHTCVDEWRRQRRRLAVSALAKMGVFCKAPEFEERQATT